ncbi:MAG: hypothetical protein LBT50_06515 [Prevotellaceae bacterium]|jgi:hypothetical protein|nr:hypothetical protein [Prevotellaceae bacterium]
MKERLIEFLSYLGIGQVKFEESVGLSRGFVNRLTGNFTLKTLEKIAKKYPELNEDWLRTGTGEMLNGDENQPQTATVSDLMELQKGYLEMIKTSQAQLSESQSQINRLITIIEQLSNK